MQTTPGDRPKDILLATLLGCLILLLLHVGLVLGTQALGRAPVPYRALLDYQMTKAVRSDADTIFVGDSSLGNAIDAGYWERLSGAKTINLALTGTFGYLGSAKMIELASASHRPRLAIIMQTSDMLTRPVTSQALVASIAATSGLDALVGWWRLNMNLTEMERSLAFLKSLAFTSANRSASLTNIDVENDYIRQTITAPYTSDYLAFSRDDIEVGKKGELAVLAGTCTSLNIRCIYFHGPLAEPICKKSAPYFRTVNRSIREAGLELGAEMPLCVDPKNLGDSEDHVAPPFKMDSTVHYYKSLFSQSR